MKLRVAHKFLKAMAEGRNVYNVAQTNRAIRRVMRLNVDRRIALWGYLRKRQLAVLNPQGLA